MSDPGGLVRHLERLNAVFLACLGDAMVDRFVYGEVARVSPEAPIPVLSIARESAMLGGAGNVARNACALGGRVALIAVAGEDEGGKELARLVAEEKGIEPHLVSARGRTTTVKTRYIAGAQQMLRADREQVGDIDKATEERVLKALDEAIGKAGALVLSDYAKGVLTDRVAAEAIARAKRAGKIAVVDPKSARMSRYDGADVATPNARELAHATGMKTDSDAETAEAGAALLAKTRIGALLVTRAGQGMTLIERGRAPVHLKAQAREVFDVSGAGDTVAATLSLALAAGAPLSAAARLANAAAGLVVGKIGTAVVHADELAEALHAAELRHAEAKIKSLKAALDAIATWRARGLSIGFTNGCFDLVHPGHVALLAEARAACDRLVVGLNTDASVKRLKGPGRPINGEMARAVVLASLVSADLVVLFDDDTPLALIEAIRPDVLVKGADYTLDKVVGAKLVQSYGGRVLLVPLREGHSTSATIQRLARER